MEHLYGYTMHDGELVAGECVTPGHESIVTSHQCHGEFLCLACLQKHAQEVGASYHGCLSQTHTREQDSE